MMPVIFILLVKLSYYYESYKQEKEDVKRVYNFGLECIKNKQYQDSLNREKAESAYWVYLKNKRTGRN